MNILTLKDLGAGQITKAIKLAIKMKKNKAKYSNALTGKTLVMLFEQPSMRTRISFEVAMAQLGGHAIYYNTSESTLGEKESIMDFAKTLSRYADVVTARINSHEQLTELAENSSVPVINAMTGLSHPCQVLADMMTIHEKKGKLKGLKLAFVGDCNNNVTHSLIYACAMLGMDIAIACPRGKKFAAQEKVLKEAGVFAKKSGAGISVFQDAEKAVMGADVVVTDSWMSYRIPKKEKGKRIKIFKKFQVNSELMAKAKKDAIFLHCLPATRNLEVTSAVMDSKNSAVFDEAENRLHVEKALLMELLTGGLQ